MTLQTALMTTGHYVLLAIGLILLLLILLLAAAFLLTCFMHVYADFSLHAHRGKMQKSAHVRFKMPFYESVLLDLDDPADAAGPDKTENSDKTAVHLTVTDEKITVRTTETAKHGSAYEIIVHTEETLTRNVEVSGAAETTVSESSPIITETEETFRLAENEIPAADVETGTVETVETVVKEYTFEQNAPESSSAEAQKASSEKTEKQSDDKASEDSDSSEKLDEIKRYVDLSDPEQFVSDSVTAAVKISKAGARLAGDLLLRIDIDKMSADVVYGLSDPGNTALSFGAAHSLKASIYAYLIEVETTGRSSKKRRKAGELAAVLQNDIRLTPDLSEKRTDADAEMSFSFWIPSAYIPLLRFLFNKNTRWVLRHYVYKYYVKQYLKTRQEGKQQKKEARGQNVGRNDASGSTGA